MADFSSNEIASSFVLTLRDQILGLKIKKKAFHDDAVRITRTFE